MIASRLSVRSMTIPVTAASNDRRHLYFTVCTANLLSLITGVAIAYVTPLLRILESESKLKHNPLGRIITESEASWIASLLAMGAMVGSYVAGFLLPKIGRKLSLVLSCALPFLVAAVSMALAHHVIAYCVARLLCGFGVASVFTILPLYIQEIAETSNRGLLSASITTFETAGRVYAHALGPYIGIDRFCALGVVFICITIALILRFVPESPYHLVNKGKLDKAAEVLEDLRFAVRRDIAEELSLIQTLQGSMERQASLLSILKSKAATKALIITWSLTLFQICSGVMPITFYSNMIFVEGNSTLPPPICSLILSGVQFATSLVAPIYVDKLGRRWMLLISAWGMCISELCLGFYFYYDERNYEMDKFEWLPIPCLVVFMISYVIGFGPLLWTIMAEIFPENMKSVAIMSTVSLWWILAFILTKYFLMAKDSIGFSACFWFFSLNCFVAAIFVYTFLIETKGKNPLEIQRMLE